MEESGEQRKHDGNAANSTLNHHRLTKRHTNKQTNI